MYWLIDENANDSISDGAMPPQLMSELQLSPNPRDLKAPN